MTRSREASLIASDKDDFSADLFTAAVISSIRIQTMPLLQTHLSSGCGQRSCARLLNTPLSGIRVVLSESSRPSVYRNEAVIQIDRLTPPNIAMLFGS